MKMESSLWKKNKLMNPHKLFIFLLFVVSTVAKGQSPVDSSKLYLGLDQVLIIVKKTHPIIQQANLQQDFADAEVLIAKGQLDPKIQASYDRKQLQGEEYWDVFNSSLKIPTWFPVDPKIEVKRAQGTQVDGEDYISSSTNYWQVSTGISLPLGQGLFIDERRALIKQSRYFGNLAEAEQNKQVNKLLLTVIKSYWEWYYAYEQFKLIEQSITIAEELYRRTKLDYTYGEVAAIDTIQAKITLQSRLVEYETAKLQLLQNRLGLSVHLWDENAFPLELQENVFPTDVYSFGITPTDSSLSKLQNWALENHPEITKLKAKIGQQEIEQRWASEQLKPTMNLSYSSIDAPITSDADFKALEWQDNYKLGLDFAFPIFLRKERGKLQKSKLYVETLEYSILQTRQEINAEIRATFASLKTNQILSNQYQAMANNYQLLLNAVIFDLENGESDLFKLNIQQDKFIESQLKALKAKTNFEKMKATLPQVIGLPELSYEKVYE
jgi:outer membrane protein TolC